MENESQADKIRDQDFGGLDSAMGFRMVSASPDEVVVEYDVEAKHLQPYGIVHGGGDEMILLKFAEAIRNRNPNDILVSAKNCLESHLVCFAAEEARVSGQVVDMESFRIRAETEAAAL